MKRQPTCGIVSATAKIGPGKKEKLLEIAAAVLEKKNYAVHDLNVIDGAHQNRNFLIIKLDYGPVAGAWPSDVLKMLNIVVAKAGSSAGVELIDQKRKPLPRVFA